MTRHAVLTAEQHGDLRVRTASGAALGDAVMSCITVPDEFRRVQDEYPILFRLDHQRDSFTALAMFGFEDGENLFLDGTRWDARYRPLAIAIQPFLVGRAAPDAPDAQVHVDLASPRIAPPGEGEAMRVFDELGLPTPYLEEVSERLGALDAGYRASPAFFAALRRHDLLEPLSLDITLDDGSQNRLAGFFTINEERLAALDAAALDSLHKAGWLSAIFFQIASLSNFRALIDRKNARRAARA